MLLEQGWWQKWLEATSVLGRRQLAQPLLAEGQWVVWGSALQKSSPLLFGIGG